MDDLDDGAVRVAYDPQAPAMSIALRPAWRVDETVEERDGVLLDLEYRGSEDPIVAAVEVLGSRLPDSLPVIAAEYGFPHKVAAIYRAVAVATGVSVSGNLKLAMCEATSR